MQGLLERLTPEADGLGGLPRYTLLERIARGSMGVVYRALDRRLGRDVALKVVRQGRSENGRPRSASVAQARLRREARAMAGLSHPNVVRLFAIEAAGTNLVIAMELVRGQTLAQWLVTPRHWREILTMLCAAGEGLAAAHGAGVVHRDVKPHNVLIGEDGRARVTDFGLALLGVEGGSGGTPATPCEGEGTGDDAMDETLTQTGMSVGTPAYMALEQHVGDPVDARTDQFGFCAMLYEALYGVRPFVASSVLGLGRAKRRMRLAQPIRGGDVPAAVRAAIVRGLAPNPGDRHPSMEALLLALRAAVARRRSMLRTLVATAFAATLACTLAMNPAAASPSAESAEVAVYPALRVPGVLTEIARIADRGDPERARGVLADQYYEALGRGRFTDAMRAAELLARMSVRGDPGATARWRRHADAARARARVEAGQ